MIPYIQFWCFTSPTILLDETGWLVSPHWVCWYLALLVASWHLGWRLCWIFERGKENYTCKHTQPSVIKRKHMCIQKTFSKTFHQYPDNNFVSAHKDNSKSCPLEQSDLTLSVLSLSHPLPLPKIEESASISQGSTYSFIYHL